MQFKIFTISVFDEAKTEEMNRFLRGNKTVNVEKQLIQINDNVFWTFCIQYIGFEASNERTSSESKVKIDYKTVLDEATFEKFSRLRTFRKKIAEEDAVPAYAVFTDAELSEVAKLQEITEKNLLKINGIGEKKVEKYGKLLCEKYNNAEMQITSKVEGF
jgi:superfamily II DNA helicase RecQ